MEPARGSRTTVEDYLAFERDAEIKHEYVNGEVLAMAGAEPEHNVVREALSGSLTARLKGRPCLAFSPDQRVRITETGIYVYPDLSVTCEPPQFDEQKPRSLLNPQIIFEILSESTEAYDRGAKFKHYQRRPSIQEYVLVASTERRIEHYRRADRGRWTLTVFEDDAVLELPCLGVTIPLQEIYTSLDLLRAAERRD